MYSSYIATLSNTHSGPHWPLCSKVIPVISKYISAITINGTYTSIHIKERIDLSDVKENFIVKKGNFS